ncbi:hypothetical protein NQ318_000186 [Aromia moschata]|uniref:Mos1 transposase HTH domain-containing protein n=1 Tax=Aromia moschata TaxID=1265417 RepID=A0AAV8YJJ9_9CUCU|nr:hypothetical protein NQ318_000186 [Aromia moschata]
MVEVMRKTSRESKRTLNYYRERVLVYRVCPESNQRMVIKFCVKLEKSAAETIPIFKKAFGVDCLSDRQIFRWHKAFAEGREDVNDENRAGRPSTSSSDDNVKQGRETTEDDPRTGRPSTWKTDENIEKIEKLIREDRRLKAKRILEQMSITTFDHILEGTKHKLLKKWTNCNQNHIYPTERDAVTLRTAVWINFQLENLPNMGDTISSTYFESETQHGEEEKKAKTNSIEEGCIYAGVKNFVATGQFVKLACLWITEVIHVLVRCAQLKELQLLPKVCVKEPQLVTEYNNLMTYLESQVYQYRPYILKALIEDNSRSCCYSTRNDSQDPSKLPKEA